VEISHEANDMIHMSLIDRLLNRKTSKASAETVAEVESALARLRAERDAASTAIMDAMRRRHEMLLADSSPAAIAAADASRDEHGVILEKLELAEPELLARLDAARSTVRRARWADIREKNDQAEAAFVIAARAGNDAFQALIRVREQALGEGFDAEIRGLRVPPPIFTSELIDAFEAEAERARDARIVRPVAPFASPIKKPVTPKVTKTNGAAESTPKPVKVARPALPEKVPAGLARVVAIRAGMEVEGHGQLVMGETLDLPVAVAEQAAKTGAVEIIGGATA
jgi:hypothetical protein